MNLTLAQHVESILAQPRPLPILTAGHPVLRIPAAPVDGQLDDEVLADLIEAMRETMHAAPGVGLAAPQVGVGLQLAVLEDSAQVSAEVADARNRQPLPFRVIINPVYEVTSAEPAVFYEGCLSVPGYQAVVARGAAVRLQCRDENGAAVDEEVAGWAARIVQHETDHLRGVLYLDRAVMRSLSDNEHYVKYWARPGIEAARDMLGF
nr:peptide deformylase [Nakamurella antarctica]